jgi:hypothetical protein
MLPMVAFGCDTSALKTEAVYFSETLVPIYTMDIFNALRTSSYFLIFFNFPFFPGNILDHS